MAVLEGTFYMQTTARPRLVVSAVYELRRRANYESVDEYSSDADDAAVACFHHGLLYLADSGLLLYETQIAQYAGIQALTQAVDEWTSSQRRLGPWAAEAVKRRLAAIAKVLA